MKKTHIISIAFIVAVYVFAASIINKSYILPSIGEIFTSLKNIIFDVSFLKIILTTIVRLLIGLVLSFFLAIILSFISFKSIKIREFMEPIYVFAKTIPNITYIIVALLWLGRNGSVILVAFLVIFPILYNSFLHALLNIDDNLLKVTRLFKGSFIEKSKRIYLPLIKKEVLLALNNACSLGFKVSIMAEILSQVNIGIGRELYYAKINYQMADIFAWTIIIIFISYLFDRVIVLLIKKAD